MCQLVWYEEQLPSFPEPKWTWILGKMLISKPCIGGCTELLKAHNARYVSDAFVKLSSLFPLKRRHDHLEISRAIIQHPSISMQHRHSNPGEPLLKPNSLRAMVTIHTLWRLTVIVGTRMQQGRCVQNVPQLIFSRRSCVHCSVELSTYQHQNKTLLQRL